LKVDEGFSGHVAASGEPLVVQDISQDARLTRLAVEQEGLRSLVVVPIGARGKISGTLFVVTRDYREVSRREVQLLASIGDQIGVAVQNARLFEGEQRRAEQFQVLSEVGRRTTSIHSTDELLNEMVSLIKEGFGYDVVEIGLVEGEELVFRAGVGCEVSRDMGRRFQSYRVPVGQGRYCRRGGCYGRADPVTRREPGQTLTLLKQCHLLTS
jgi:GAF domain-containing protein